VHSTRLAAPTSITLTLHQHRHHIIIDVGRAVAAVARRFVACGCDVVSHRVLVLWMECWGVDDRWMSQIQLLLCRELVMRFADGIVFCADRLLI